MKRSTILCGFLILASVCIAGQRDHVTKPIDPIAFDVGLNSIKYDAATVNLVTISNDVVTAQLVAPCEMIMPVTTTYSKRKFVSFNKRLNTFNKLYYGESVKQKNDHILNKDPLSNYTDEDIERPAWQLNWASLVKLDI
jgi:hypothetical protein